LGMWSLHDRGPKLCWSWIWRQRSLVMICNLISPGSTQHRILSIKSSLSTSWTSRAGNVKTVPGEIGIPIRLGTSEGDYRELFNRCATETMKSGQDFISERRNR
jgi:hypothetical protein